MLRLLLILVVLVQLHTTGSINVALHAQARPSDNQIVGSVITTDGLKAALEKRFDIDRVSIFYPSAYEGFMDTEWDLLVIEGWFLSIVEFIQLMRNRFHGIKIVFYCLDPIYPSFNELVTFDVDGILTNSAEVLETLPEYLHKDVMLLAADENIMQPLNNTAREFGSIYVGAGGPMLAYKPSLHQSLLSAVPFGLRLHGSSWDQVDVLRDVWRGSLPRQDLASAYASAEVVLASTMAAQASKGMINNRIFEALSCGTVVVSDHSPALEQLLTRRRDALTGAPLPDLILFYNESHPAAHFIEDVRRRPAHFEEVRRQARAFVLSGHTWSHRAVQLLDFYHRMVASPGVQSAGAERPSIADRPFCPAHSCQRLNCPRLLWLASDSLTSHQDYLQMRAAFRGSFACSLYEVHSLSQADWFHMMSGGEQEAYVFLEAYDVLLAVASPFDSLDLSMACIPASIPVRGKDRLQRRAFYLLGFDSRHLLALRASLQTSPEVTIDDLQSAVQSHYTTHYDVVLYRSSAELSLLQHVAGCRLAGFRSQHLFGVGPSDTPLSSKPHDVVVCLFDQRHLCSTSSREKAVQSSGDRPVVLLLLGGAWQQWMDQGDVIPPSEVHRVLHVKQGEHSPAAEALIQTAVHAYFMQPARDLAQVLRGNFWSTCVGQPSAVDQSCLVDTADDVFWPFVAAAASPHSVSLHFLLPNDNLFAALEEGVGDWTGEYFDATLQDGLNRMHSFGSRLSSVTSKVLALQPKGESAQCSNCHMEEDPSEARLLRSGYLSTWFADADKYAKPRIVDKFLVKLSFENFKVGRDGECCVEHRNTPSEDTALCMVRPFSFVQVLVVASGESIRPSEKIDLRLFLRGNFFADIIYSTSLVLDLSERRDLAGQDGKMLPDEVFVYTVHI